MPSRLLREQILTSRAVNQLSERTELFYRRLMSVVDDFGRFEADPELLLARVYPLQVARHSAATCGEMLQECCGVLMTDGQPLISVYEVGNHKYLQINNFGQRARVSKYPAPPDSAATCGEPPQTAAECGETPPSARADACRASTPTPPTPPNGLDSVPDSEPRARDQEIKLPKGLAGDEGFRCLMGVFIAFGVAISERDIVTKIGREWASLDDSERVKAVEYAQGQALGEWRTRPTHAIPRPWNYLSEQHWNRRAPPRIIKQTSEKQQGFEAAAARFLAKGGRDGG